MKKEIWKDVKGFEGFYKISNIGRVLSVERTKVTKTMNGPTIMPVKSKILKLHRLKNGYFYVALYKESFKFEFRVHKLVALHFVPGYKSGLVVNHKDEDKSNNCADNLEWCTIEYNMNYGTRNLRSAESNYRKVIQMNKEGSVVATYPSAKHAARATGYNYISLCEWCRGAHLPRHNNYLWKYE